MKLRAKLAIIVVATLVTLAGLNLFASAIVSSGVIPGLGDRPSVTFEVTSVRVLI